MTIVNFQISKCQQFSSGRFYSKKIKEGLDVSNTAKKTHWLNF